MEDRRSMHGETPEGIPPVEISPMNRESLTREMLRAPVAARKRRDRHATPAKDAGQPHADVTAPGDECVRKG